MAAVAGAGQPQQDAARELYERFHASIYRYALSQVRSPQDAEDATQNTFLRAFAALQRGVVPENEAAWLFKIAHNVCVSSKVAWLRRRRVETPRDLDALTVTPAAVEQRRDELHGLDDALAAMPPRLREAFLLREWQGLSYDEIAARMDTSHSAVETLIFRARRMLAQQLEAPRRRVRRAALGLGQLLATLRGLAGGGSLAVTAAGVGALAVGVTVAVQPQAHRTPAHRLPAVAPVNSTYVAPAVAVPVVATPRRTPHPATPQHPAAPQLSAQTSLPAPLVAAPATPAPSLPAALAGTPPVPTATPPAVQEPVDLAGALPVDVVPPAVPTTPPLPALPPVPSVPSVTAPAATVPQLPLP